MHFPYFLSKIMKDGCSGLKSSLLGQCLCHPIIEECIFLNSKQKDASEFHAYFTFCQVLCQFHAYFTFCQVLSVNFNRIPKNGWQLVNFCPIFNFLIFSWSQVINLQKKHGAPMIGRRDDKIVMYSQPLQICLHCSPDNGHEGHGFRMLLAGVY